MHLETKRLVINGNGSKKIADSVLSLSDDWERYFDFNKILQMPKNIKPNTDRYDKWSNKNWGSNIGGLTCTVDNVSDECSVIYFDTVEGDMRKLVSMLSGNHTNNTFVYEEASNIGQTTGGFLIAQSGKILDDTTFEPDSKSAKEFFDIMFGDISPNLIDGLCSKTRPESTM